MNELLWPEIPVYSVGWEVQTYQNLKVPHGEMGCDRPHDETFWCLICWREVCWCFGCDGEVDQALQELSSVSVEKIEGGTGICDDCWVAFSQDGGPVVWEPDESWEEENYCERLRGPR